MTSKIYDKRDDFDFDIVYFRFWMVTFLAVHRKVYTFRNLFRNHVSDFHARNKLLTAKLLQQGYRYHNFEKHFLNFIADIIS